MTAPQAALLMVSTLSGIRWSSTDKSAAVSLSNNNLTATGSTGGAVRGTSSHSSGKYYFEVAVGAATHVADNTPAIGVITAGQTLTATIIGNGTTTGTSVYPAPTAFTNGPIDLSASFIASDVWGIAVDITTGKVWYARNNTYVLSGNPAAGTNPSITINTGLTLFPGIGVGSGVASTARFAPASWTYSAPSGFSEW